MTEQNIFKGKITLNRSKGPKKSINFKFDTPSIPLDQVVMHGFKDFNFQENEKRELSSNHRKIIRQFQHLCPLEITRYSNELVNIINSTNAEHGPIEIEASDAGTFICLTAIYSGRINNDHEVIFKLSSSPLRLFPKNLAKNHKNFKNIQIKLDGNCDCWFSKLESISKQPVYLKIKMYSESEDYKLAG
ncbi:hypothetical protein [Bacteriovorax sp. Seq25_V]|uniref:hypothetical protein n=1 Tax=Bacteriovorax sp. Seq25_V TaxID=1201288 RepID=UPI00038A3028|nr:hypothetical protein [Bacteriovorax sp. Seq25_V]EQC47194.1 hypothetical protein M900_0793 [Bacteriovorax sp. Seq25_V]